MKRGHWMKEEISVYFRMVFRGGRYGAGRWDGKRKTPGTMGGCSVGRAEHPSLQAGSASYLARSPQRALHTFVCKYALQSRTERGQRPQSGRSNARMVPSWLRLRCVVRAEGIEPSRPCGLRIFIPLRLSPPRQGRVRGLDYPFTVPHMRFRCCPSSLYTFPEVLPGLARDCHLRFPRL
jgi:hypothetical protein